MSDKFNDYLNSDDTPLDGNDNKYNDLSKPINVGGGQVIINPGTGPVSGATEANAIANMHQYLIDCPMDGLYFRRAAHLDYGEGRFAFLVLSDNHPHKTIEVQMPGWELAAVRILRNDDQNPFLFPRLYIDGSSWLWCYGMIDAEYFEDEDDTEAAP